MEPGARVAGSFKERYDFEQQRVHDASTTFFVPFSFRIIVPPIKPNKRATYRQRQKRIEEKDGKPGTRENWVRKGDITWVSESEEGGGARVEFKMLKLSATPAELSGAVNDTLVCDWPGVAPPMVNGSNAVPLSLEGDDLSSPEVPATPLAFLDYLPSPKGPEEAALWTKARCAACCQGEGVTTKAAEKIKSYTGEDWDVDNTKRKCRDGEVTTTRNFWLKAATNEMCQNNCPQKSYFNVTKQDTKLLEPEKQRNGNNVHTSSPKIVRTKTIEHTYQEPPKKGKEAGWTEKRCENCCNNETSNKEVYTYKGEKSDPSQRRKCKNGRTTSKTTAKRPATDQECKQYCKKQRLVTEVTIDRVSARIFRKVAAAVSAGKSLDELTIARSADPDAMSPSDALTLDLYQSMYTMPDLISEYVTKDWVMGEGDKISKESMLVLPSKTNKFQVTVDEFGTARPGTSRDMCQRSWIFPKRLREEHVCRVLASEDDCNDAFCAWRSDDGVCGLSGNDVPEEPLAVSDLFHNGVANRIASTEICRRVKAFAQNDLSLEFTRDTRKRRQFPSYSAMRYAAIASLDTLPCDVEGNTENNLLGFRTQQCFSCELSGSEDQKSRRWRCAVEHRREGLVNAMSSLTGDWKFQSVSGEGGCPRRAAKKSSEKYSEASYFRTLLYMQADRVTQYLNQKYSIPAEEIKSITVCGEDIRPSLHTDDVILKKSLTRDRPVDMHVRSFGSTCVHDAQDSGCQQGLVCALVQEGKKDTEGKVYQCAFKEPSIGQPCYQFKSEATDKWTSNCASPMGAEDPRKSGKNEATLKCLLNTCTLVLNEDYHRPSEKEITVLHMSGKQRFVCREDSDCPKSGRGGKGGKCLKEPDCANMRLFAGRNDKCTQSHHTFPNSEKKQQLGL